MTMTTSQYVAQQSVAFVRRHHSGGGRLLDVGCGHGDVAVGLSLLGYEVTGIDPAADKIEGARCIGVDTGPLAPGGVLLFLEFECRP